MIYLPVAEQGNGAGGSGESTTGKLGDKIKGNRPALFSTKGKTLFIKQVDEAVTRGETILKHNLEYETELMESKNDTFYMAVNHKIIDTAELFANDGFTPSQWNDYQELYNTDIDIKEIKERVRDIKNYTTTDLKRAKLKSYRGGHFVLSEVLQGQPNPFRIQKKILKPARTLRVFLDITASGGVNAQRLIETTLSIITIINNTAKALHQKVVIEVLDGTRLGVTGQSYENLILWNIEKVKEVTSVYSWIHKFLPTAFRCIGFIWHANISKVYDLPASVEEDFKNNGMGQPYPSTIMHKAIYSLEELYEQDITLSAFREEIQADDKEDVIFLSMSKCINNYNSFSNPKEDVAKFLEDFEEFQQNMKK